MRITALAFIILVNEALAGGGGGKHHVHFKIHVPDIIKHHIHTKTVFIHVHHGGHGGHGGHKKKMVPKKKETHHEESHHEDWSSWSSYGTHGGHGDGHEHKHHGTKDTKTHPAAHGGHYTFGGHQHGHNNPYRTVHSQMLAFDPAQIVNMQMHDILHSQYAGGNVHHPVPPQNLANLQHGGGYHDGELQGYSFPPQYGAPQGLGDIRAVNEPQHNDIEPYSESFEEGYHKGHHSQTGHLLSKDLKNFYDNKFEEGDFSNNGYDDQSHNKYKTHEDSTEHDTTAVDHDNGYNYHDGDSYLSGIRDSR